MQALKAEVSGEVSLNIVSDRLEFYQFQGWSHHEDRAKCDLHSFLIYH